MTLRFDGRVALVTGAGGGLGRAHALLLAERGAHVVVNDLGPPRQGGEGDPSVAAAVVEEIEATGGSAVANADSVADPQGAAAMVQQALDTWGRLDIVVNNAGITGQGVFAPPEIWERVVGTHLLGTANVLRAAYPVFEAARYGRIVNTSSSSFLGTPGGGDYAAAKGGIIALSRVLVAQLASQPELDIKVNVLMPVAYTRMTAAIPDPVYAGWLERHFPVDKVAPFVALLCHESVPVSGETFTVGGGRAARLLIQTTAGHFDPDPTPEAFFDHFDAVMAGEQPEQATMPHRDLARYVDIFDDPGPFAS